MGAFLSTHKLREESVLPITMPKPETKPMLEIKPTPAAAPFRSGLFPSGTGPDGNGYVNYGDVVRVFSPDGHLVREVNNV